MIQVDTVKLGNGRTTDESKLAQSSSENEDVRSFIEQAYRRCFGRRPELVEIAALEATRREFGTAELFAADILWALLNSAECQYLF